MGMHQLDNSHLQRLRDYQPKLRDELSLMKAAVAMIFRDTDRGTEVLLMQRAFHPKDPWSGQMAFPGGKIDPVDNASSKAAAVREAFEEVGAELGDDDYIGQLDDLYGLKVNKVFSVHIACYVFKPQRTLNLIPNEEVADMVWLPLAHLADPINAHDFVHPSEPSLAMPAVMINADKEQILWGLSLRMLSNLHQALGGTMDVLSEKDQATLRALEQRKLSKAALDSIKEELNEDNLNTAP